MKKYHVATGDGKAYYGVGYESYREAEGVLKISKMHDPQAHIVEEEYHFTNADRIRAMSDGKLAELLGKLVHCGGCQMRDNCKVDNLPCNNVLLEWLKQPAENQKEV